jgi:F-type H+-transporting ATPase subunit b|tara:strand:- start:6648 stop:7118 length:471 start_codon:yes stop_codon:yes gene_type:complete|mmetsp:Transcript_32642/g.37807  ORF Transcript_32642/g.37807 Transcript_32642/m.37807 type:complete len:157 (+) Transcript_32642:709-1179(+)
MINFSLIISSSAIEGPGGLFDINATLPLVAIQFVLLTIVLNTLLYNPLLTAITERNDFILITLLQAVVTLEKADNLTAKFGNKLKTARQEAELQITNSQKTHKEILELELDLSQKYIDNLLDTITKDLSNKKQAALSSLDNIINSLCTEIETKLSI